MRVPPVVMLVAAIALLYGRTLGYGLVWDDYVALRARTAPELWGAWTGAWDPSGPWPVFYRPLSIALYHADFVLFGHNGVALHAGNLILLFAAAWMTSRFVTREVSSRWAGLTAALMLVAHPETPTSLAAWISQQFHLAELIAVLAALLIWQRVRDRSAGWWLLVLLPVTAGVLIKEDALVAVPAVWLWQWTRSRHALGAPPPRGATIGFALWGLGYLSLRTALVGVGGYGTPDIAHATWNIARGSAHALFIHVPPVHAIGNAASLGLAALLVAAWRRRSAATPSIRAFATGALALGVLANGPLALISGHTRIHFLILSVSLLVAAAGLTLARSLSPAGRTRALAGAAACGVLIIAANWLNTDTFAPCTPQTRETDDIVLQWDSLPPDGRAELLRKIAACDAR